jgi:hypothetical protein
MNRNPSGAKDCWTDAQSGKSRQGSRGQLSEHDIHQERGTCAVSAYQAFASLGKRQEDARMHRGVKHE